MHIVYFIVQVGAGILTGMFLLYFLMRASDYVRGISPEMRAQLYHEHRIKSAARIQLAAEAAKSLNNRKEAELRMRKAQFDLDVATEINRLTGG